MEADKEVNASEPMPMIQKGHNPVGSPEINMSKVSAVKKTGITNMSQIKGLKSVNMTKEVAAEYVLASLQKIDPNLSENPLPACINGKSCSFPMDEYVLVQRFIPRALEETAYLAGFMDNNATKQREFIEQKYRFDYIELDEEFRTKEGAAKFLRENIGTVRSALLQKR